MGQDARLRQRHPGDPRLPRRARHGRPADPRDPRQAQPARLDHRRDRARRGARAGGQPVARRARPQGSARLPDAGPLRHRLGRRRCGHERVRAGARLHLAAHAFGRPIAGFQLTQQKLVELHNDIGKGLLLAYHFGRLKQDGKLTPEQVSYLKRDNVRMALESARTARSMLGGNGIMGEFHIMRHLCNLETVYTYEGTHEIHTLAIGRALTGLAAFNG
ncbi:acyl-CoA dehydrogenase family protein [Nannocystis pusilla]|uniref:Acyl-CoA dehydrogenase family protein n=1 Tax=Nannocystis pusilla TaxID=889268 RepID=A0A9X3EZD6_9BACT|nr:acyl-CoA dehydrogenase family protein [Nannocystis pusilla]